jgi:Glycosyl hydrolase family 65 central catalytic domain
MGVSKSSMLVSTSEPSDPGLNAALGNGYFGALMGAEFAFVGGIYNGQSDVTPSHRAKIPWTLFRVNVSDASGQSEPACALALDLENAAFVRRTNATVMAAPQNWTGDVRCPSSSLPPVVNGSESRVLVPLDGDRRVFVEQRWFASRVQRAIATMQVTVEMPAAMSGVERYYVCLVAPALNVSASDDLTVLSDLREPNDVVRSVAYQTMLAEEGASGRAIVAVTQPTAAFMMQPIRVFPGAGARQSFVAALGTSLDARYPDEAPPPRSRRRSSLAASTLDRHARASRQPHSLYDEHRERWHALWQASSIGVEGDAQLAAQINATVYALLLSVRVDWPFSASPGGLATPAYSGHVFWDAETWMQPGLLLLHPSLATMMMRYRFERLGAARRSAALYGMRGAKFPWESASTGVECTPDPGPFGQGNPEGALEIHINGDIVLAAANIYRATRDRQWLRDVGLPVARAVAEYWASRVYWNETAQLYTLLNVQPPDEGAGRVNSSAYTNAVCATSLSIVLDMAAELGVALNASSASLYRRVADNMLVPFDEHLQVHQEYIGYNASRLIHQADVALLQYPLGWPMSDRVARNDLRYWQRQTDPNGYYTGDSSYSIAWLRLGELDEAAAQWKQAFAHIKPPFNVWQERIVGGHTHFATGAGGFLQNVLYGYVGAQLADSGLVLQPRSLPPGPSTALVVDALRYVGVPVRVAIDASGYQVSLSAAPGANVTLVVVVDSATSKRTILTDAPLRFEIADRIELQVF